MEHCKRQSTDVTNYFFTVTSAITTYFTVSSAVFILSLFCLLPFFYVINTVERRKSIRHIFTFTLLLSLFFFSWIINSGIHYTGNHVYAAIGGFILCVVLYLLSILLVFILFSTIRRTDNRKGGAFVHAISIALVWMCMEEVRLLLLSGFPYLDLRIGYAMADNNFTIQWVSVFGTGILTFFVIFINWYLAEIISKRKFSYADFTLPVVFTLFVPGIGFAFKRILHPTSDEGNLSRIALITHNLPPEITWSRDSEQELSALYFKLTREAIAAKPDLIVWTESAFPWQYQKGDYLIGKITSEGREAGIEQLLGVNRPVENETGSIYNSALLIDKNGYEQTYDKRRLLTLIESPLSFGKVNLLLPMLGTSGIRIHKGREEKTLLTEAGTLGLRICNEAIYPVQIRNGFNPEMLLVIGNDSWFENTYLPFLHLLICRLRALETGKDVIVNISRGYTGLALHDGSFSDLHHQKNPSLTFVIVSHQKKSQIAAYYPYWFTVTGLIFLSLIMIVKSKYF